MPSEIIKASQAFKRRLLQHNDAALKQMSDTYAQTWTRLKLQLDRVTALISEAKEHGEFISPAWLFQQERFKALMLQCEIELQRYGTYAASTVTGQQNWALGAGESDSRDLMGISVGKDAEKQLMRLGMTWNRMPTEAVQHLAGFLADGSPLDYKFAGMAADIKQGIKDAITAGMAAGENPRTIRGRIRKAYGDQLTNSLTVCRTEALRAYRTATHATYKANSDVCSGWIWLASVSDRTCMACLAMNGSWHKLSESFSDHPCGRCTSIPTTKPLKEIFPGYHGTAKDMSAQPWNPEEHFDKLSDEQQLKVMGPTRYALYKADKIKLTDLASKRESKIWGDCYVPRTVTELVESGKVTREDVDSARQS